MGERRRVVVTGLGVLSGPCHDPDSLWRACVAVDPGPTHRAIIGFEPRRWLDRRAVRRMDHFAQIAVAAALGARGDAGDPDDDPERVAVVLGTGNGGLQSLITAIEGYREEGRAGVPTLTGLLSMSNAAAASVAYELGARGHTNAVASGCASGTHAITDGFRLVRDGSADVAYVGGSDAAVDGGLAGDVMSAALANLWVHTEEETSRPFDAERSGFVHAAGAAILRLETLDAAVARGAHAYAEVLGGANTVDGHDMIHPAPGGVGLQRCMRLALAEARRDASEVGHVNCHGTGTRANDLAESQAAEALFGSAGPALNSTKAVTGHAGGAAGAIEGLLTVMTVDRRLIPQTQGCRAVDPEITADVVTGTEPRPWEPGLALSNSVGLGGQNGTVVIGPVNTG